MLLLLYPTQPTPDPANVAPELFFPAIPGLAGDVQVTANLHDRPGFQIPGRELDRDFIAQRPEPLRNVLDSKHNSSVISTVG